MATAGNIKPCLMISPAPSDIMYAFKLIAEVRSWQT